MIVAIIVYINRSVSGYSDYITMYSWFNSNQLHVPKFSNLVIFIICIQSRTYISGNFKMCLETIFIITKKKKLRIIYHLS